MLRQRRGSVLVITLMILISLAGLTLDLSDETVLSLTLSGYARDKYAAQTAARSATHLALDSIASDPEREVDSLEEDWAKPSQGGAPDLWNYSGRITDESAKLNLNNLLDEKGEIDEKKSSQLNRLFGIIGLGEEKVAPLLDWLDKDDIERMDGAESHYYQGLEEPHSCGNGPFLTLGQVSLVKGIDDTTMRYLTVYTDGKININTASPEVLRSLSEKIDASVAEAITLHRTTNVFRKPEDLKKVPGMSDEIYNGVSKWVTVSSSAFLIEAEGTASGISARATAVAVRDKQGARFIYWKVH